MLVLEAPFTPTDRPSHAIQAMRGPGVAARASILAWLLALIRLLLPATRATNQKLPSTPRALTTAMRVAAGLPLRPATTQAQDIAAYLRYAHRVVQAQPSIQIARRLARRLGVTESADLLLQTGDSEPTPEPPAPFSATPSSPLRLPPARPHPPAMAAPP